MSCRLNGNDYISLGVMGAGRSMLLFPIEQPLEAIKSKCQVDPLKGGKDIIGSLYKERGLRGFFDGGVPNLLKRAIRTTYRWPTVAKLHGSWKDEAQKRGITNEIAPYVATAVSIASIETICVLPLERLFMSKIKNQEYSQFIRNQFKVEGVKSLYRGSLANFLSHCNSWTTFMVMNHGAKHVIEKKDNGSKPSIGDRLIATSMIASSLTFVSLPWEFIRVHIQSNPSLESKSTFQVAQSLLQQYGIKKFYAGCAFAFSQKFVQAFVGGFFFEQLKNNK